MRWNIDKELAQFEPETAAGTSITRIIMDLTMMKREGITPTAAQIERGTGVIWCLGIGYCYSPKAFFYAQTIRSAFLKARRAAKAKQLAVHTPWGVQNFLPKLKRHKPKERKRKVVKQVSA